VDYIYGKLRRILARHDPMEIDERCSVHHREPDTRVVAMIGVGPTVPIVNALVRNRIVIRPLTTRNDRSCH